MNVLIAADLYGIISILNLNGNLCSMPDAYFYALQWILMLPGGMPKLSPSYLYNPACF